MHRLCLASAGLLILVGCDFGSYEQNASVLESCSERFPASKISDWAARVGRLQDGEISVSYMIELPFDDAKQIENAIAQMPGELQQLTFADDGVTQVTISGAQVPVLVSATATESTASDDTGSVLARSTYYPIVEELCANAGTVGGTLINISVQTSGYRFDDGKLHAPLVP